MRMLDKHRHIVPVEEAAEVSVTPGVTPGAETGTDNVDVEAKSDIEE